MVPVRGVSKRPEQTEGQPGCNVVVPVRGVSAVCLPVVCRLIAMQCRGPREGCFVEALARRGELQACNVVVPVRGVSQLLLGYVGV